MTGGILLSAEQQVFYVFCWLAVLILLQISVYPSLKRTFGSFAFPVSFSASLLLFTVLSWYCGLMRIPVFLSLIPFLLLLVALFEPGVVLVVLALGLTGWMGVARLVRAEVRSLRERPFVEAARALGVRPAALLGQHVVPNALAPALVATALGVGNAIMLEAGLSFLGLGVQPPTPSWGNMIAAGRDALVTAPWVALAPAAAVARSYSRAASSPMPSRPRSPGSAGAASRRDGAAWHGACPVAPRALSH